MRTLLTLALALFTFTLSASAQGTKGSFIIAVDDHATLYLNGTQLIQCKIGTTRSPSTEIKPGDHLVVQLFNKGGPKHFLLVFEAADGKSIASFRAADFKVVPERGVTNFDDTQFRNWVGTASKRGGSKGLDKQIKNYSDWMWGDVDRTTIACVLKREMFTLRPK
jgi:hypothetical protein